MLSTHEIYKLFRLPLSSYKWRWLGYDEETEIYCYLSDRYVGVTKTRWLENGYSYINTPSDYPLGDINKINEN